MGLLCGIIANMITTILRGIIITIICSIPINIVSGAADSNGADSQGVVDTRTRNAGMRIDLEPTIFTPEGANNLLEGNELDKLGEILPQSYQIDKSLRVN